MTIDSLARSLEALRRGGVSEFAQSLGERSDLFSWTVSQLVERAQAWQKAVQEAEQALRELERANTPTQLSWLFFKNFSRSSSKFPLGGYPDWKLFPQSEFLELGGMTDRQTYLKATTGTKPPRVIDPLSSAAQGEDAADDPEGNR